MSETSGSNKSSAAATPSSEPIWLGIGSPRPQPRVKQNSMFGHVVDAFDEKSIVKIGEVTPYEKRIKAQEEMRKAAAEATATGTAAAENDDAAQRQSLVTCESESISEDAVSGVADPVATAESPAAEKLISESNAERRLLIKGGKIVNDDQSFEADIYVEDDQIKLIQANIEVPSDVKIIDASGKLVFPGGIDTSTHFQEPFNGTVSVDNFYSGTKAALSGGTTMIIDCVVPGKDESLLEAYDTWRQWADANVCCDYSLRVLVRSWSDQIAQDMETLTKEKGVNTYVIESGSDESIDDTSLYRIFKHCRKLGAVAQIHPKNLLLYKQKAKEIFEEGVTGPEGFLISQPEEVEAEAVNRAIAIGSQAGAPVYISNVTGKASAEVIEKARRKGKCVFGEAMLAALVVDGSHYFNKCWRHAAGYVTSPPLRTWQNTGSFLTNLLANADLQMVSSDHRTFNAEQKALGKDDFRKIPSGVNGVMERMSAVWENAVLQGKIDPCRFVAVISTNAAKAFNLYPKKGRIAVGSDADIVVWDPEEAKIISAKSHLSRCDFNVFEDLMFRGVAKCVISRGHVIVDEEGIHELQGSGQFLPNPSNPEFFYNKIWIKEKAEHLSPVQRDPYQGPVIGDGNQAVAGNIGGVQESRNTSTASHAPGDIYSRPLTRSGGRNMQDSSFSLSGMANNAQADDPITVKKGGGTRVNQPPGGRSTQFW